METIRATEAARHGLSRTTLQRRAQEGRYERIARGLYRPTTARPADDALIEAAIRRPDATLCLISALAHHQLIDDIPDAYDLAIPRSARRPATQGPIRWHRFATESFNIGRQEYPIPGSDLAISIYGPERCIVDAFRLRGTIGYETALDALKEWLARGGQPAKIATMAKRLPRATGPLMSALAALT